MSPFALRFTQEHIRTTFRDGRSVEAAVAEIKESPGSGDYDVILRFPFPAIEIVRWHVPHHHCDSPDPEYGSHWIIADCIAYSAQQLLAGHGGLLSPWRFCTRPGAL